MTVYQRQEQLPSLWLPLPTSMKEKGSVESSIAVGDVVENRGLYRAFISLLFKGV